MAVFRVERNKGYTVMSNHHLRCKELSLKAKGLLSQMLSLPEDWDYTLRGLSKINRESIDAIRTAVWELEKAGYIVRRQGRDKKGKMTAIQYIIYEKPQGRPEPGLENPTSEEPMEESPIAKEIPSEELPEEKKAQADFASKEPPLENPVSENPTSGGPQSESPVLENPTSGNPTQINKELQKKERKRKDVFSSVSFPSFSFSSSQEEEGERAKEGKRSSTQSAIEVYREMVKDRIGYGCLLEDAAIDQERLDEIVGIVVETLCTARKTIRIAGDEYPASLVKERFLQLDGEHIRFVFDCMRENSTKIRNIRQYLRAVLFNAPTTIGHYYSALAAHDMASGKI